jgi:hypothetical protein
MVMFPKDLDVYFQHKDEYFAFYNPVGPVEKQVVQNIADSSWKVNLCTALQGRIIFGQSMHHLHKYPETNHPEASEALAAGEAVTDGDLTKQLANLSLYEQRYHRIYEKARKEIEELQSARKAKEEAARNEAHALLLLHEAEEEKKREDREAQAEKAAQLGLPSPDPYIPQPNPPAYEAPNPKVTPIRGHPSCKNPDEPNLLVHGFVFSIVDLRAEMTLKQRLTEARKLKKEA